MPPRKTIDDDALLKMVQDGLHQKEILTQLGLKTGTQLKLAYIGALMNSGQVPAIQSDQPRRGGKTRFAVRVNKRGSLIIPPSIADRLGLKEGDAFDAAKTKSGLALQATTPRPVVKLRKKTGPQT
jgi:AbrB family looped-hinge helix DNA binding protein